GGARSRTQASPDIGRQRQPARQAAAPLSELFVAAIARRLYRRHAPGSALLDRRAGGHERLGSGSAHGGHLHHVGLVEAVGRLLPGVPDRAAQGGSVRWLLSSMPRERSGPASSPRCSCSFRRLAPASLPAAAPPLKRRLG